MSLSLIKPISALASSSYSGYPPNLSIDGITTSHWVSSSKNGVQWISFDLGGSKNINGVNVYIIEQYAPTTFDIQISSDNSQWENIVLGASIVNGDVWTQIKFEAVDTRYVKFIMKSSASSLYLITEVDFLEAPVSVYNTTGEYVTDAIQLNGDYYKIRWLEDKPLGTNIVIEFTTDETQNQWIEVTNGEVVYVNTNIWIKATLSTSDTSLTPTLHDLWLEEVDAPQDRILITMDWWGKFNNVVGDLTVAYDATKGSLTGAGGAVESFEVSFTPEDLVPTPNPGIQETITVAPAELVINHIPISYHDRYIEETITVAPAELTVNLIYVGVINP